jgi:predicted dehydrogenase
MLNAAIVGLGRWGRSLVNSVHGKSEDIRFVAGATRTRESAEEFCRGKSIRLHDSFEDVLRDPEVEAVVLATPNSQHGPQIERAAAAGRHVFVEKPITLARRTADAAVEVTRKHSVLLAVGFPRRFSPAIAQTRERLRDGRLGTLVSMVGQQSAGTGGLMARDNWRSDPHESPAGSMTGVGVHLLDNMIELGGRIREVVCHVADRGGYGREDTTNVLLSFENGLAGVISCSVSTAPNFNLTVYGTKGLAEISKQHLQMFRFTPIPDRMPEGPVTAPEPEIIDFTGFDMLHAELTAFARSIRDKVAFPVNIDEVLHGMSVFDAIVKSAETKKIVSVAD